MKIEYYLSEINAWILLNVEDYMNIIFNQEDQKLKIIKSLANTPIKLVSENENENMLVISNPENLIYGNYIEVLIQQDLSLTINSKKKTHLSLSLNPNYKRKYDIWALARIVSYDLKNKFLFLEYNEKLILIEDLTKIRPLSEIKKLDNDISIYYIKKISNSEYKNFKTEYEALYSKLGEEEQKLLFHNFNSIKSSLLVILPKNNINDLPSLKEFEKSYSNTEENNSHSNNIEKSDKNKKSNGLNGEEDILNEINKFQYKKTFAYKSFFKKDSEKILKSIIKKNQYFISVLDSEEFKIIIYGNDEKDFNEEKGVLEKEYKPFEKKIEQQYNKSDLSKIASQTQVKFIYFGKKMIYLIGKEKNISNFNKMLDMNLDYSKAIQQSLKEKEDIEKKLDNIKKKKHKKK
jgi:hypothetical protein